MSPKTPTELMRFWEQMDISVRLRNTLLRHYYRTNYPRPRWSPECPDEVNRFLADAMLPFDESPLRNIQGLGVIMYQQLQDAANRVII